MLYNSDVEFNFTHITSLWSVQTELFIFWFWLISVLFYRRVSRDSKQVTINCLTPCCQGEGEPGNTFSSHNFKCHRAVAMWRSLVTGQRWVSRKPQLVSHLYGTCPLATSPFWNASKARKQKTVIKAACGHLHTLLGPSCGGVAGWLHPGPKWLPVLSSGLCLWEILGLGAPGHECKFISFILPHHAHHPPHPASGWALSCRGLGIVMTTHLPTPWPTTNLSEASVWLPNSMLAPCSKGTSGGHCSSFRGTMDSCLLCSGTWQCRGLRSHPMAWLVAGCSDQRVGSWVFPCCSQPAREYMLNYKTCTLKKKKSSYVFLHLFLLKQEK